MPRKAPPDRGAALSRHWAAESAEFGLKPWEVPPCMATTDAPPADAGGLWRRTWARARELRLRLLAANPNHYDDIVD